MNYFMFTFNIIFLCGQLSLFLIINKCKNRLLYWAAAKE